jgi:hypothetical protein
MMAVVKDSTSILFFNWPFVLFLTLPMAFILLAHLPFLSLVTLSLQVVATQLKSTISPYLTECIYSRVLDGQLPHEIVNLLFAITD